ncbi:MAG: putative metal-binding transcription factor (methanogenesis marker protein 9), partial [Reinekea sp.]
RLSSAFLRLLHVQTIILSLVGAFRACGDAIVWCCTIVSPLRFEDSYAVKPNF